MQIEKLDLKETKMVFDGNMPWNFPNDGILEHSSECKTKLKTLVLNCQDNLFEVQMDSHRITIDNDDIINRLRSIINFQDRNANPKTDKEKQTQNQVKDMLKLCNSSKSHEELDRQSLPDLYKEYIENLKDVLEIIIDQHWRK